MPLTENEHNRTVEEKWDTIWENRTPDSDPKPERQNSISGRIQRYYQRIEKEYNLDRWFKEVLLDELGESGDLKILEAGCGEGETAISINDGRNKFFLLDISKAALNLAKGQYKKAGLTGQYVNGSIFGFPFKSNAFDVVLSVGIFEHFKESQYPQLIEEHVRIARKGGRVFILVPNRRAYFYRIGKWYAQRNNMWEFGYEQPLNNVKTLYSGVQNVRHLKEYTGGLLTQFYFTMYLFRKIKVAKILFLTLVAGVNRIFWFVNRLRLKRYGFFIINIIQKT